MGIDATEHDFTRFESQGWYPEMDDEVWCNDECDTCPSDGCCTYCCTNAEDHYAEDPEVCACGDEEWGACPKDTCYDEYDEERNAI